MEVMSHHHRVMRSRFSLLVTYMCHVMGVVSHHHSHEVRSRFSLLVTYMCHVMGVVSMFESDVTVIVCTLFFFVLIQMYHESREVS